MIYWLQEHTVECTLIAATEKRDFGYKTTTKHKKKQQTLHLDRSSKLTKISSGNSSKLGVRGGHYLFSQFTNKK